jgi:hypothetical protein
MTRIAVERRRILLDGRPALLLAGEVHYFRVGRRDWGARLRQLLDAGADTVATYVPWLWHELPDGAVDLTGRTDPRRDLTGFLDLAAELGLRAIVRPGPFVMAELKNEGVPYRLSPALAPTTWDGRPVPSRTLDYLAPDFLAAVDDWYAAVMPVIADRLVTRDGPVVAVQLDNEIGMLSWVTNSPDLTPLVRDDLRRWAELDVPDDVLLRPDGPDALAVHDLIGRYMRHRYARYVAELRAAAERHGVTGVPFLVNVHGTGGGRARTYPVGLSQLYEALRGPRPGRSGVVAGTDLYLGDLTVGNVADLCVADAFTAAAADPDQPLTSLEFEAGNGDYGERLEVLYPPESIELKTRLAVAQGNRLLNLYLFAGGDNPPLAEPTGDGNDRIATTGQRHGFAAPVDPEGRTGPWYDATQRVLTRVRGVAELLAGAEQEVDGVALAFVADHYLTEYAHPAAVVRAEQVAALERFRPMGADDVLARGLLLAGYAYSAVDVQRPLSTPAPPVIALASPPVLRREVQERLASYVHAGGTLLLSGVLPGVDHGAGRRARGGGRAGRRRWRRRRHGALPVGPRPRPGRGTGGLPAAARRAWSAGAARGRRRRGVRAGPPGGCRPGAPADRRLPVPPRLLARHGGTARRHAQGGARRGGARPGGDNHRGRCGAATVAPGQRGPGGGVGTADRGRRALPGRTAAGRTGADRDDAPARHSARRWRAGRIQLRTGRTGRRDRGAPAHAARRGRDLADRLRSGDRVPWGRCRGRRPGHGDRGRPGTGARDTAVIGTSGSMPSCLPSFGA